MGLEDLRDEFQQQQWAREERYDVAQICPNGHVITEIAASHPVHRKEFCQQCGEKTFMACGDCGAPIQGHHYSRSVVMVHYQVPRFCHNCGSMFPWTRVYLEEARELVEEFHLTEAEKAEMKQSIENLAKGVKTEASKAKFKRLFVKGGQQVGMALLSIMTNVAGNVVGAELLKALLPK